MSTFFKLLAVLSFASYFECSFAILKNVTYDNTDSSVIYLPSGGVGWELDLAESLDFGGTHALADDTAGASAVFHFTGVAVYYFSPLWPYNVSTVLSLDGGSNVTVSLMDKTATPSNGGPPTVSSAAQYAFTGLSNGSHTLSMFSITIPNINESNSDPSQQEWIVVDGFNVTIEDDSAQPSTASSSKSNIGAIVGGAAGGVLVLAAILAFFFIYHRRTRRQRQGVQPWGEKGIFAENSPAPIVPLVATPYSDSSPHPSHPVAPLGGNPYGLHPPPPMQQGFSHQSVYSQSESGYGRMSGVTWAGSSDAGASSSQGGSNSAPAKEQPAYFNEKRLQQLTVANEEPLPPPAYTVENSSSGDQAETEITNSE
ncbi:hypothetical protein BT96DRAFT_676054 [Gymnopus androsaceus JB14]|uniref:Mid2 domain-containing protein n=1 Tax=Gymnopus androsaceus JB14 TaxID=1447944 RepID=A0A6A4HQD0_9AGAR|nr:hypothetical protein BT96DRAFT_676054 [Gymnopus androsaceus JB14]